MCGTSIFSPSSFTKQHIPLGSIPGNIKPIFLKLVWAQLIIFTLLLVNGIYSDSICLRFTERNTLLPRGPEFLECSRTETYRAESLVFKDFSYTRLVSVRLCSPHYSLATHLQIPWQRHTKLISTASKKKGGGGMLKLVSRPLRAVEGCVYP